MKLATEKRALQVVVSIACLVPLVAGFAGVCLGVHIFGEGNLNLNLDSHFRYLSGLLLGVGIAFLSTIPNIEFQERRFKLLTLLVVCGGGARLVGIFLSGTPALSTLLPLIMEIGVTPILSIWQNNLALKYAAHADAHADADAHSGRN